MRGLQGRHLISFRRIEGIRPSIKYPFSTPPWRVSLSPHLIKSKSFSICASSYFILYFLYSSLISENSSPCLLPKVAKFPLPKAVCINIPALVILNYLKYLKSIFLQKTVLPLSGFCVLNVNNNSNSNNMKITWDNENESILKCKMFYVFIHPSIHPCSGLH